MPKGCFATPPPASTGSPRLPARGSSRSAARRKGRLRRLQGRLAATGARRLRHRHRPGAVAKAHSIVPIKDDQPASREKIEGARGAAQPLAIVRTVDGKRRDRHETGTAGVFDANRAVAKTQRAGRAVAAVEVGRVVDAFRPASGLRKRPAGTACHLSNPAAGARPAATAVREHRHVGNKSHRTRDVGFREDASRIRETPGLFARPPGRACNILRTDRSGTIARDRHAAASGGLASAFAMRLG